MGAIDVRQGWKDFQTRHGLVPDGVPGQQTLEAVIRLESNADTDPGINRFGLGKQSQENMDGIHPDLLAVVHYAIKITQVDFGVPKQGGVRTLEQQKKLLKAGRSKTLHSRHLTGHAIDVYAYRGKPVWNHKDAGRIHNAFVRASRALSVPLRWGGDWDGDGDQRDQKFVDSFHHELPRSIYGISMESRSQVAQDFLASIRAKQNEDAQI